MGARLTAFENRSRFEMMEIRILNPSARPDQFLRIAKVRPGEIREVVTKSLVYNYNDTNNYSDNPSLLMVLLGSNFVFLQPMEVLGGAKIICDIDDSGKFQLRIIKGLQLLCEKGMTNPMLNALRYAVFGNFQRTSSHWGYAPITAYSWS